MSSWKKILSGFKSDAPSIKNELIMFSVIYIALNVVSVVSGILLPNLMQNKLFMAMTFLGNVLLCVLLFINQYFFQKAYSEKKKVPATINGLVKTLLRIIQVGGIQMLIIIGALVVINIVIAVSLVFFAIDKSIVLILFGTVTIVGIFFGFLRLAFVPNIALYTRLNWKSRTVIKENLHLIKANAFVVLPLWFLPFILLIPKIIENLNNPGLNNPHILLNGICIALGLASSIATVNITVQAVIEHKYCFMLKPEEPKKLEVVSD